jgi:hypothetical protein
MHNYHNIKVAFYKGSEKDFHHRFIRWWTKSKYSHVELILNNGDLWISISPFLYSKVTTRIKVNWNLDDWDFLEFKITDVQMLSLKDFIAETTGDGYDWPGMLLSQVLPYIIKSRGKWYCSSWIAHALSHSGIISFRKAGIYEVPDLHPGRLYSILQTISSKE